MSRTSVNSCLLKVSPLILVAAFIAVSVIWQAPFAVAQVGTGEVNGTVTDQSGAVVPGASVTLVNQGTRLQSQATANSSGYFAFVNVKPASYVLQVRAQGFKLATFPAFDVGVSQVVTRDAKLSVGEVTQTVEVSALPPLLQPSSTELGTVISTKAVNDLPLNGRNFTELLLLTPGVTPINSSQGGTAGGTPDGGIVSLPTATVVKPSFHGSQNRSVIYYQDGIINTDFRGNVPGVPPNPDLIQEFDVVSHDTRADVGGVIGGVVNIVSKSGTNQFHGSVFEFARNNAFDARDTFKDTGKGPAPYHQNQFGATAGGRIWRDHTFFYAGYSAWRYSKPTQSLDRVPTAAELNGDFSVNPFGDVLPIYNPYSTRPDPAKPGSYIRDPFMCTASGSPLPANADGTQTPVAGSAPCNILPASLISPAMQDMLKTYLDVPNLTGDPTHNFIENQAATDRENDFSVKVDHRLTDRDNLFFRFSEMWDNSISRATPKTYSPNKYHYHNEGGGWVHSFTPTLILDARAGNLSGPVDSFSLSRLGTAVESKYFKDISTWGGLNGGLASPYGGPGGGFFPNQDNFRNNPGWNVTANLNWIKGNHNFKFGYDYNLTSRIQINQFEQFNFTNANTGNPENSGKTGNSLASALLGLPSDFSGQLKNHSEVHLNAPEWALYIQDEWKLKPRLTFNWGLRWDVTPLASVVGPRVSDAVDIFHQTYYVGLSQFPVLCSSSPTTDPCMPQPLSAINDNSHIVLGGKKLQVPKAEYDHLGPRVGLAWQMTPNTVLRGGYGLYFDTLIARTQTAQNDLEQLAWPYTTGFSGSANAPTSAGVPPGGAGNPLVSITSLEGSFPNPVPPATPWTPHGWADDPNIKDPYSHEWNMEIQRQFGQNLMISAAYVGSISRRLAYTGPNANAANKPSPAGTPLTVIDTYRAMPFLQGAYLYYTQDIGRANYNSLELKAVRRLSHGLQSQLSFTWGRSLDNSSGYYDVENGAGGAGVQNYFDPMSNYGASGYDIPKYLTWYTVWDFPAGPGKQWFQNGPASWVLGNWQLNYIVQARSGQVYTPGLNAGDVANIFGTDTAGVRTYERPDLVGNPLSNVPAGYLFNAKAFVVPATGTYGTLGRSTMRSPAVFNADISLFKNIPLGRSESRQLQLRFESFNAFNVMNWGLPSTTVNSKGAGLVTSLATSPREFQFAARIVF